MSLDVYLHGQTVRTVTGSGIFIRESGANVEISRDEWDRLFPGREPVVTRAERETRALYHRNITHNLAPMAEAAGLYVALWRPDENSLTHARQIIEPLASGLVRLLAEPEKYRAKNPSNGWGNYEGLVAFVADYLKACIDNPDAEIEASR